MAASSSNSPAMGPASERWGGLLLIVGKGPCVWDDLEAFWDFGAPHDVCCINHMGLLYPCDYLHWYSYQADWLADAARKRPGPITHSVNFHPGIDAVWRGGETGGSSALQALLLAFEKWGYARAVLAGVPLTNEPSVIATPRLAYRDVFLPAWKRAHRRIAARTRSLSGNTKALLGPPDPAFLFHNPHENKGVTP